MEYGGTGPFKAIVIGELSLPQHTIYRPQDLSFASKTDKLPVILFGNGGCANNSDGFKNFLNEIASYGYVIIAIGPLNGKNQNGEDVSKQPTQSGQLLDALDWIIDQNKDKKSQYYNKINVGKVAVMGQSCGGLQAIDVSADPRINTSVILNSGVLNSAPPSEIKVPIVNKDALGKYHNPVIYIIGDSTDIAYPNAMDDFSRIKNVPMVMANLNVGHGGTYRNPHGGEFARTALYWLNWQLKGQDDQSKMFLGDDCGLCNYQGWRIETKNFK